MAKFPITTASGMTFNSEAELDDFIAKQEALRAERKQSPKSDSTLASEMNASVERVRHLAKMMSIEPKHTIEGTEYYSPENAEQIKNHDQNLRSQTMTPSQIQDRCAAIMASSSIKSLSAGALEQLYQKQYASDLRADLQAAYEADRKLARREPDLQNFIMNRLVNWGAGRFGSQ